MVESNRPRVEEDCLYVEDDEDQGEHIISDVELNPRSADRLDARFVGSPSVVGTTFGPQHLRRREGEDRH